MAKKKNANDAMKRANASRIIDPRGSRWPCGALSKVRPKPAGRSPAVIFRSSRFGSLFSISAPGKRNEFLQRNQFRLPFSRGGKGYASYRYQVLSRRRREHDAFNCFVADFETKRALDIEKSGGVTAAEQGLRRSVRIGDGELTGTGRFFMERSPARHRKLEAKTLGQTDALGHVHSREEQRKECRHRERNPRALRGDSLLQCSPNWRCGNVRSHVEPTFSRIPASGKARRAYRRERIISASSPNSFWSGFSARAR